MVHVVAHPVGPLAVAGTGLVVWGVPVATDNLAWLVVAADGEAAVVDSPAWGPVEAFAAARGWRVRTALITHTHGDHVGFLHELRRDGALDGWRVVGPASRPDGVPGMNEPVDEGDLVTFGGATLRVLRLDGHLNGHIGYVVGDVAFTGDVLFTGGCGYLFDGPPAAMWASLQKLSALPPETRVCCAHEYTQDNLRFAWSVEPGNAALADRIRRVWALRADGRAAVPSTIGEERATNPFLRGDSPELRASVAAVMGGDLGDAGDVFAATRELKNQHLYRRDDEGLPLAGR